MNWRGDTIQLCASPMATSVRDAASHLMARTKLCVATVRRGPGRGLSILPSVVEWSDLTPIGLDGCIAPCDFRNYPEAQYRPVVILRRGQKP